MNASKSAPKPNAPNTSAWIVPLGTPPARPKKPAKPNAYTPFKK